jgi:hypothetical protein
MYKEIVVAYFELPCKHLCGEAEKTRNVVSQNIRPRMEPWTSRIWSTSGIHFATFDALVLQVPKCRTQHFYLILVSNLQAYVNRNSFFMFLRDELPDRLQCCFTVVLVERLYIFCDVVIPKIILLLFPIICSSSWMSLYQKDRGYSFLWCHEFRSFFYVLLSQWWQKGCRSFSRNFLFCGRKHILHISLMSVLTHRPRCNALLLRYCRISPGVTSNSSAVVPWLVVPSYYVVLPVKTDILFAVSTNGYLSMFWVVTLCGLVGGMYLQVFTALQPINIFTAVRTSNLTQWMFIYRRFVCNSVGVRVFRSFVQGNS